jgi:hypothetical protein
LRASICADSGTSKPPISSDTITSTTASSVKVNPALGRACNGRPLTADT